MFTIFGAGRVNATVYLLVMYNHYYFYKKKITGLLFPFFSFFFAWGTQGAIGLLW